MHVKGITAVLPAFNRESTIRRALASVLAQTRRPDAVIVVDDGSSDRTAERVREFGDRVRLIQQPNAGAAAARNVGVAAADTEWVAFLDSDDYWQPDHLEKLDAAIAATDGCADVYFADVHRPASDGSLFATAGFRPQSPYEVIPDASDWVMLTRQPTLLQASVVRRSRYQDQGGMPPHLLSRHDTHLFLRLGIGHAFCACTHTGTVMTEDATERVTRTHGCERPQYWRETVWMYRDVLRGAAELAREHREQLRLRLASGHLRLCRFALRRGNVLTSTWHLARAGWTSPQRLARAAARRLQPWTSAPAPTPSMDVPFDVPFEAQRPASMTLGGEPATRSTKR